MSTSAVLIQWGMPVVGRERMAIEEFGSYMQWASQMKSDGKIDRFEVYAPRAGAQHHFTGFTVIEGSDRQIADLLDSEDFRMRLNRVLSVTRHALIEPCVVGAGVGDRMKLYNQALQQLKL